MPPLLRCLLAVLWASTCCGAEQQPTAVIVPSELWNFIERAVRTEIQPPLAKLQTRMDAQDTRLQSLDSRLVTLDSRVDAMAVRLYSQDSLPTELANKLDSLQPQLDRLLTKVDNQQSHLDGLVAKLDSQQSQLDGLLTKLDSQQSQLDGLLTKVDNQQSQQDILLTKVDNQQSQLDGLLTKVDNQQSQQDGLLTKVDNQQSQQDRLLTKVDNQQSQLDGLLTKVNNQQSQQDRILTKVDGQQSQLDSLTTTLGSTESQVNRLVTKLDNQQSQLAGLVTNVDGQQSQLGELTTKTDSQQTQLDALTARQNRSDTPAPLPRDCSDLPAGAQSGVHQLRLGPDRSGPPVPAFCDLRTDGGGWTVFQRRADIQPRQNFSLGWADYKKGFGELDAEFWWGLDNLWVMTSPRDRRYELRVSLEDFEGETRHAVYQGFRISSEKDGYRLSAANYTGDAGDSLNGHTGRPFATHDTDEDVSNSGYCAGRFKGGWWYKHCFRSKLNGKYQYNPAPNRDGIVWKTWRGSSYSLKTVEMKIRPSGAISG